MPGEGSSMIVSASVYILNVKDSRTDSFREYNNYREEKNQQKCKAFECKIIMPLVFEKTAEISCKVALNNPEKVSMVITADLLTINNQIKISTP